MAYTGDRNYQIFPVLTASQIETVKRFAGSPSRAFAAGEALFGIGDKGTPTWLVLQGSADLFRHEGLGGEIPITSLAAGQFSGEVAELSGRPSLAGARAGSRGCTAIGLDGAHLRSLIIGSAEVGELLMRAFILRRVGLISNGGSGSVLLGTPGSGDLVRLQGFLTRNGYPNLFVDASSSEEGLALIDKLGILPAELPLMICPNGTVLKRPSDVEASICLGITPELDPEAIYDVAIVGAGPAGLATAVYAASEGLKVIVLDERSVGGQAGASARIENYLGFPTGISGQALAGRAFSQALKFGAEIVLPVEVLNLIPADASNGKSTMTLELAGDRSVNARTVVVASGARYRRPDISNIGDFEESGVSYWASAIEAKLCEGEEIAIVGGGNSAGQAVAFLAPRVKRLHLVVRRALSETMSQYLIDRISATPNVEIHTGSEITALEGDRQTGLSAAVLKARSSGEELRVPMRHVFLFIGADPNAIWVKELASTDEHGFLVTGRPFGEGSSVIGRSALALETSVPNLFAIGDVRCGSTKRVAAAVGEGAAVVAQIHAALHQMSAVRSS